MCVTHYFVIDFAVEHQSTFPVPKNLENTRTRAPLRFKLSRSVIQRIFGLPRSGTQLRLVKLELIND